MKRGAASILAAVTLAGLVVVSGSTSAAAAPRICGDELSAAARFGTDVSNLGTGRLGFDGRSLDLRAGSASWLIDDPRDATFTARFHSMTWLVPALDDDVDVVGLLLEREAALPDPGGWVSIDEQRRTGWVQSVVTLRIGVVTCLYEATHDARLIPVMDGLANAALDPLRYRGRPLNRIHNHGTLSNLALVEAAVRFDRPEWREAAIARFDADSAAIFSTCGLSTEQSTSYHLLNVKLWRRALGRLAEDVPFGTAMGQAVHRAEMATWLLTRPDAILEAIGDGNEQEIAMADLGLDDTIVQQADTRLYCSGRGWAANRGSWDDTATQYTLRFGDRPRMHGHEDRGAVTWFTQGVPVFSDRGLYDKAKGQRRTWAQSAAAHSTFEPQGFRWPDRVKALLVSTDDSVDEYVVTAKSRGTSMERRISIPLTTDDSGLSVLQVEDSGRSPYDQQWFQRWQLAPGWRALPRATAAEPAAVNDAAGLYLYGTCWSGAMGRGYVRAVEHFPGWRTSQNASAIECGTLGTRVRIDTIWVVSDTMGTLNWDRTSGDVRIVPDVEETAATPE